MLLYWEPVEKLSGLSVEGADFLKRMAAITEMLTEIILNLGSL